MNIFVRSTIVLTAIAGYLLALLYILPADRPYFIVSFAVVGLAGWMLGVMSGILTAAILVMGSTIIYQQFSISTSYATFFSFPAYLALQVLAAVSFGHFRQKKNLLDKKERELEDSNNRLQKALLNVKEVGGRHNLCSHCKSIQSDAGDWQQVDFYLKEQTKMEFSHCMCPDCAEEFQAQARALAS